MFIYLSCSFRNRITICTEIRNEENFIMVYTCLGFGCVNRNGPYLSFWNDPIFWGNDLKLVSKQIHLFDSLDFLFLTVPGLSLFNFNFEESILMWREFLLNAKFLRSPELYKVIIF